MLKQSGLLHWGGNKFWGMPSLTPLVMSLITVDSDNRKTREFN